MLEQAITQFQGFSFSLIRIFFILISAPFFGSRSVPIALRVGLSIFLALIITPISHSAIVLPETAIGLVIGIIKETLIGLAIGLIVRLVFSSLEIAGHVTGMQMGFAVAMVIDPQTNTQLSVLSQFYNLTGILLFFAMNGHLIFISAIKKSFDLIPAFGFHLTGNLMEGLGALAGGMFTVSLQLAAPMMVALLLANIAMGVLARTVPQMNIFLIGFPITITLGIVTMLFSLPFVVSVLRGIYLDLFNNIIDLFTVSGVR